ncbi:MAG: hypothetical protein LQ343_000441 [Gyalolechia ehrenbergii]|nr:MAG: hypothetical protein LQ343_000441 [Gyalolechia ehrenbergii]
MAGTDATENIDQDMPTTASHKESRPDIEATKSSEQETPVPSSSIGTSMARSGFVFGAGIVFGPIVGGDFAQSSATWRWGFYLNLVVGALFAPVYLFLLPPFDPRGEQRLVPRLPELDVPGMVLSIGVLVCTAMATNLGGTLYPWMNGQIISLFVAAGVLLCVFVLQQRFAILITELSCRIFPTT